ncbi:hypothetical protein MRX96_039867 [Rhipicephalus microplus]
MLEICVTLWRCSKSDVLVHPAFQDSRRKATPSAPGSSKSSTTLASSRRMAASVGKSSPSVHGGTPVGASGTAARNIRRRSIKILQKKMANKRQLFTTKGADGAGPSASTTTGADRAGPSASTGVPVSHVTNMSSFARFLVQQSERQLTRSVLCQKPGPLRPEVAESVEQLDVNLTDNTPLS